MRVLPSIAMMNWFLPREPSMSCIELNHLDAADAASLIRTNDAAPPVRIPQGHIGPVALPGTGRMVWWTGRVAIGLRHQPTRNFGPITQSALWVQNLLLQRGRAGFANA
jgi:hypothetical protein